eukprot:CAMPEP_0182423000 /NCGR_PEP_ID=MMETSP1167-20130531/8885_1 /TAXON_ID=2988 /ORGANISM="Mallomonas Sp, Strain CCMP3275" /LENGTH=372 /DNA_ID=CAMNT_0024601569 /DNA_START=84 /DNA_END=1202 /DNA_ORIENTATION=+
MPRFGVSNWQHLKSVWIPTVTLCGLKFYETRSRCDFSKTVKVDVYRGQTVIFRDKESFEKKRQKFVKDGASKLQVVSDFDYTLSTYKLKDSRCQSTHGVIETILPPEAQIRAHELSQYYYPLEVSANLDFATKCELMREWTMKSHDLLVKYGITRKDIKDAVRNCFDQQKTKLREEVDGFFLCLQREDIPLLVFSAGIGDVVEELLYQGLSHLHRVARPEAVAGGVEESAEMSGYQLPSNVHVVSNRMIFSGPDPQDRLIGFEDLVFHVFNKRATSISHTSFLLRSDLSHRENLLLVGDSLGDPHMSEGLSCKAENTIKIAYLNDHLERLPSYLEAFDLIILGDPSFSIPVSIVNEVILADSVRCDKASSVM